MADTSGTPNTFNVELSAWLRGLEMLPTIPGMPKYATQMMLMPWAVGQFIMEWGKHERMLAALIAAAEQRPYLDVRDELLVGQIVEYERRLQKVLEETEYAVLRQLLTELLDQHIPLRAVRNDLVHGFWAGMNEDEEYVLKRKTRRGAESMQALTGEHVLERFNSLQRLGMLAINARRCLEGKKPI